MGILLVVGFLVTVAGAWFKFKAKSAAVSACISEPIDLKGHGTLRSSSMTDGVLTLIFAKKAGEIEIVTLNSCSGKILSNNKILVD